MPENTSARDTTAEDIEAGRRLFTKPCQFLRGVLALDQMPEPDLPEIAFAGRSNVGKSSLINALTGRSTLARTSDTPGRTQEINFFELGARLTMADLPGYGFAKAPKDKVETWTGFIRLYLKGRPNLRRVLVLVDARHGFKDVDREIMKLMDESAVNYQIVLTKADKLKPPALSAMKDGVVAELAKHVAGHPEVLATSSYDGFGLAELRAVLSGLARPEYV